MVGSARKQSWHQPAQTAHGHARNGRSIAPLLAGENVTFHGEFHHVTDIQLDVVHGRKGPRNVPIYIGATGMKMME